MKNPFALLTKNEWILWIVSVIGVVLSNVLSKTIDIVTLGATLVGVTALIFVAKGNIWGQILTVLFSVLYSVTSFRCRYYGEMITYLGMTMPMAAFAIITWIRHPFKNDDGNNEVEINKLSKKQIAFMLLLCGIVTLMFYYVLKFFNTPNLVFSTMSIVTSFLASYLMLFRASYYAIAYACNDIILIVLWILATFTDISYLPMIFCFVIFFVNDIYGFISWKAREKHQMSEL